MDQFLRRLVVLVVAGYATLAVQTGVVNPWAPAACVPNLLAAGLVWMVGVVPGRLVVATAAGWGLVADGLCAGPLGTHVVSFAIAAWLVQRVGLRGARPSAALLGILAAAAAWVALLVSTAVRLGISREAIDWRTQMLQGAGALAATGLVTIGVVIAWRAVFGSRRRREGGEPISVSNRWQMLTE